MSFVDYYDVLQVSPRADADVIEKAYRALISKHHPDKGGDTRDAQRLNEAHDVIGDPSKRVAYDREWARQQHRAAPSPAGAASAPSAGASAAPRAGRRHSGWSIGWVVGFVLILVGMTALASGSALVGLLLTVVGVAFVFNLTGLWLVIALLAVVVGAVVRFAFRAGRSAYGR